jgi:O-antigen/teichoic acid export membrane protein
VKAGRASSSREAARDFIADVGAFGFGFAATNVIAFAYVVAAGRTLAPAEFAVFNALFGLITVASYFSASIQLAATEAATRNSSNSVLPTLVAQTARLLLPACVLATIAALPFGPAIGATAAALGAAGATVFVMFASSVAMGVLVGLGRIRASSLVMLAGATCRLLVGWPLMLLGLGIIGALLGYLANFLLVFFLAYALSMGTGLSRHSSEAAQREKLQFKPSTVATSVIAFLPFGLDQILVQLVAPTEGAEYAALATTAKLVFFGAYPVAAVMYPRLLAEPLVQRRVHLLLLAIVLVLLVGGAAAAFVAAFPGTTLHLLFHRSFDAASRYVGPFAYGILFFSVSALSAQALIAWQSRVGYLPSAIATALGVALFALRHDSLGTLVSNQLWVYGVQFVLTVSLLATTVVLSLNKPSSSPIDQIIR